MFGDMGKLMKQVGDMKAKMGEVEKELKNSVLKGSSRDNAVAVEITGKMQLKTVTISDNSILGDKKKIENAFYEAIDNALKQATEQAASKLAGVTGGIKIPGLS